jgi:hypothetical protein
MEKKLAEPYRKMDEEKTRIPDPLAEEPYLITTDRG